MMQINSMVGGGKWRILHLVGDTCDRECREALFLTRQTRKALSKKAGEVDRIALTNKELHPILSSYSRRSIEHYIQFWT